jgi:hypothetical protein
VFAELEAVGFERRQSWEEDAAQFALTLVQR